MFAKPGAILALSSAYIFIHFRMFIIGKRQRYTCPIFLSARLATVSMGALYSTGSA